MRSELKAVPGVRDQVSEAEWQVRVDLAACYRLVARQGWDDLIYTHISARVPGEEEHFLINPFGLHFWEITASSLVKIDHAGNKVMDSPHPVNPAGFVVHYAVHKARADAACVLHMHTPASVGVATQAHGLLPITQNALLFHDNIAYHDYEGLAVAEGEIDRLGADLGDKPAMILRNHGILTLGRSVSQAYVLAFFLERACQMQVAALSAGRDGIVVPSPEVQAAVRRQAAMAFQAAGTMEWAGLIRLLDREDPTYKQ